jgi:hypothetical protein
MPSNPLYNELRRLRRDFDRAASRYSDLTLSISFVQDSEWSETSPYRKPNHAIPLWQYLGNATAETAADFIQFPHTPYGFVGARLTAFGIIEGADSDLFRRMALRAGSLIPSEAVEIMDTAILDNVVDRSQPGKPVFSTNSNALAIWLNYTLVCLSLYQPERIQDGRLSVDPYAASLVALDVLLKGAKGSEPERGPTDGQRHVLLDRTFDVALSFPGERRDYVAKVAMGLRGQGVEVFYDRFFEPELAVLNLDALLQKVYHERSKLIVVFLCEEYPKKEWCGLEWRAIRDIIKSHPERIMLLRFDSVVLDGVFSLDGYVDLRGRSPRETVKLIRRRVAAYDSSQ